MFQPKAHITSNENVKRKIFFASNNREQSTFFQPKLQVGPVDDMFEREADAVADKVISTETDSQPAITPVNIQRKCAKCQEEEELQRKEESNDGLSEVTPLVESTIAASGKPLDNNTRSFMENRFGYDFGNVKVHTDAHAAQSAQSINALAYTSDNNIVFNQGQYSPETQSGKRLLAHELTHVVQQRSNSVLRKKIQRQQINLNSGRIVGDTAVRPANLKEDVVEVMDSLHAMWSMPNADYAAEYPTVGALPAMSMVPIVSMPHTIAAIRNNEAPLLNNQVANGMFGLTITAPVGNGGTNNKSDIFSLQDYLHTRWFLSNPDYTSERAAVTAGADPVATATIPSTLRGLSLLKIAKVAEGYQRHDVLNGMRTITASQRNDIERILIPGYTPGSAPEAICSTPALETEIRAIVDPFIRRIGLRFRTRHASAPVLPLTQIRSMGDIVESEIENYFGPFLRAATSVAGATYTFGQYNLRSQLNDQTVAASQWQNPGGRQSWVNYWISTEVGNNHRCNQGDIDTVANHISTDAALIPDIDDGVRGWPAEATGGININPYLRDASADPREIRRARWDAFTTILHEAIHHLAHPNFVNTYNQMRDDSMQILKEGFNDLFRRELWDGPGRLQNRISTPAYNANRAVIEGAAYPYDATVVEYHGDYSQITQARQIQTIIGNTNAKAAYFLGHTEFLGLGAGSHGLNATGNLLNIASYHTTDPDERSRVDTIPGETYDQLLVRINARPGTVFRVGGGVLSSADPLPARVRVSGVRHITVIAGDTIDSIAYQNGVTRYDIVRANAMTSYSLTIGQRLLIPIH